MLKIILIGTELSGVAINIIYINIHINIQFKLIKQIKNQEHSNIQNLLD